MQGVQGLLGVPLLRSEQRGGWGELRDVPTAGHRDAGGGGEEAEGQGEKNLAELRRDPSGRGAWLIHALHRAGTKCRNARASMRERCDAT